MGATWGSGERDEGDGMTIDELARLSSVDDRLKALHDKLDRGPLTEDETFELQKLLDQYERLIDRANSETA